VLLIPALRAIKEHFHDCALHLLVPSEVTPLFAHLPWLTKVWGMPRTRGRARLQQAWPLIRALRRERFDRSVDFGGNDRGAIASFLCGARERLSLRGRKGFWGRRFCYTQTIPPAAGQRHEVHRNIHVVSAWDVPPPSNVGLELHADPAFDTFARQTLPHGGVVCHLATTQPKKEWALQNWAALFQKAGAEGLNLVFSTGRGSREQALLQEFLKLAPAAPILPDLDLAQFLAVIKRADVFVSGDTGPLHFAAGLGVRTVSLFGATSAAQWGPLGPEHEVIRGSPCHCGGDTGVCLAPQHCMAAISTDQVLKCVLQARSKATTR